MDKNTMVIRYFPKHIQNCFTSMSSSEKDNLNEISLVSGQALLVQINGKRMYAGCNGTSLNINNACTISCKDLEFIFGAITNSSEYAYSRFITDGFITLPHGHRVGIVGNCVVQNGKVTNINNINALCFRLTHDVPTNANLIFDDVYNNGNVLNTLIISPPGCGKTSLIRRLAELISGVNNGKIVKCAIIDERYELASCHKGTASFEIGKSSFVISGCPKSIAIPMVVRSMSPDVIFTDEVSNSDDIKAVMYARASGCKIIATVHGFDEKNNELTNLNYNNIFDRMVILDSSCGPGTVSKVI